MNKIAVVFLITVSVVVATLTASVSDGQSIGGPFNQYLPIVLNNVPAHAGGFVALGVGGMPTEDFDVVVDWHGRTVEYRHPGRVTPTQLQDAFDTATSLELSFILRGPSRNRFSTHGKIDYGDVTTILHNTFDNTTLLGDSAFVGYYLIDEPCHSDKYSLSGQELAQLHSTVKTYDPNVPLMVNFGTLECLIRMLDQSEGAPVADVAAFTITAGKTTRPAYIERQASLAAEAKGIVPHLRILPLLAVFEDEMVNLPGEEWVRTTGLAVLAQSAFDGLLIYPWRTPRWATRSLDDVASIYGDDVAHVFQAAG